MKKFILTLSLLTIIVNVSFSQPGWFWQNPLPQGNSLGSVKFINTSTGWAVGSLGTILRTTNGGTTWTLQLSGTTNNLSGVSFTDANNGTAVGNYGTIVRTTDGGANWNSQSSSTTNSLWSISFTDANNGTAVGRGGTILRTTNGGGTFVNQISNGIPEGFSLYQNYPNPFNPKTNIRFDLRKSSHIKLIVYDILGREIATLVDEKLSVGSYEVDWDGSNFSSGVYFYKLVTDGFVDVRKMVLLK